MAIITTYICDVSGVTGDRKDFVEVSIGSKYTQPNGYQGYGNKIEKLVHKDVAVKLGLVDACRYKSDAENPPAITFEGKLKALLEDHVAELVQEHLDNQ